MVAKGKTDLLVALDCGSSAREAVDFLNARGVDTIVIDHHPVRDDATAHAYALVNPKLHQAQDCELAELCTAGLVLLVCHRLAEAWACREWWDHEAATILACLGALGDACAMTKTNRGIVRAGLDLINREAPISRIVGLAALLPRDPNLQVGQRRLQFEAIPKLNALGRLGSAEPGVELLTTDNPRVAREIAARSTELNRERQVLQQQVVESAGRQARARLSTHPNLELLVLAEPSWHHGVVGPAASRIVERFGLSAILLGRDGPDTWRGSGRSYGRDDLGAYVSKLRTGGLIHRGGGHSAAVGLGVTDHQLEHLQRVLPDLAMPKLENVEAGTEVIGEVDDLPAPDWQRVLETLEPFRRGNPSPIFTVNGCLITANPTNLALSDGIVWACKAEGRTRRGHAISVVWRDAAEAKRLWRPGHRHDLLVELNYRSYQGRLFYNWIVLAPSRPIGTWNAPRRSDVWCSLFGNGLNRELAMFDHGPKNPYRPPRLLLGLL